MKYAADTPQKRKATTDALTKFRFVHDGGFPASPQLLDLQSGEDVIKKFSIENLTYYIDAGSIPTVTVNLFAWETDVQTNVVWQTKNPMTNDYEPLAAMEFRDGTRVEFDEDGLPSYKGSKG